MWTVASGLKIFVIVFEDVLSSPSETDSELSHADSELSDSDGRENIQQDQLEQQTAKYVHVISLFCAILITYTVFRKKAPAFVFMHNS